MTLLCIGAGALASMRLVGGLRDRSGPRGLVYALLVFAVAACLPPLASTELTLIVALTVLGAASGALDVAINAEAARFEAAGRPVMSLAHAAFSAAVVVGSLLTGLLRTTTDDIRLPFVLAALVLAAVAVRAGRIWVAAPVPRGRVYVRLGVPRPLALLGVIGALAYFVENAWQSWSAIHIETSLDASAGVASLGPALFAAAAVAGRLASHRLTTSLGERRLLGLGAAVAAAGTGVAAAAPATWIALAGIATAGLGTAVCAPTVFRLAGLHASPSQRASAISIVTTIAYGGFVVGPALVGLAASLNGLRTALAAVAGVAVVLLALSRASPVPPRH